MFHTTTPDAFAATRASWNPPSGGLPAYSAVERPTQGHHHSHRHKKRAGRPAQKKSTWNACCGSGGQRSALKNDRKRLELRERTGMAISIDSDDENDWDRGATQKKVWGDRQGPQRERPVDDLLITLQDVFPCFAPIFDACGCSKRRPRRTLPCKLNRCEAGGPKFETVCLDCGNVLHTQNIPRTVGIDMFDRGTDAHHQAFVHGVVGAADQNGLPGVETFEGYKEWTVAAPGATYGNFKRDVVPLPQFGQAPARIFYNRPTGESAATPADSFALDASGLVELPSFPCERP